MHAHEKWLNIAKEDLAVAKLLASQEFPAPAAYHSQQSAEKALKGFLIYKKQFIMKTHDLTQLLELCLKFDTRFAQLSIAAKYLTIFSSKFRYPTEFDLPNQDDALLAIKHAQIILRFVLKKTRSQETGQTIIFET
jgi:HEPN domain-containing protein